MIRMKFGDAVAAIVSDCTDSWVEPKPPWRAGKKSYVAALPGKSAKSLLVSLADKTHNAEAILFDYRELGDALWGRFTGGAEGTRRYYSALADMFSATLPGAPFRSAVSRGRGFPRLGLRRDTRPFYARP